MDRGEANGIEELAARLPGEYTEGGGSVWRAECCQPNIAWLFREHLSRSRERVHVRGFALVRSHPCRSIALDVLDRFEALASSQLDIL